MTKDYTTLQQNYEESGNEAVQRILVAAKINPGILDVTDPWKLFGLGVDFSGLDLTLFQATWALAEAKRIRKLTTR